MDASLTLRSFTQSSTSFVYPIPVYVQVPYGVELARRERLASYAFHDHFPPGLAFFTFACPPGVRLRIRVNLTTSVPVGLWTIPTVFETSSTTRRKLIDTIRMGRSECMRASYAPSGCTTILLPEK